MSPVALIFVALSTLLAPSQGHLIPTGDCPDRPILQGFDSTRYLGQWFEILRYDQPFEIGCSCVTATYTLNANGTIGVKNCCSYLDKGTEKCDVGEAELSCRGTDPLPGQLTVGFYEYPQPDTGSNYWILDTDYDNYSIVHSCASIPTGQKYEAFWLLSRTPVLENEKAWALVDKYFDKNIYLKTEQGAEQCKRS